MMGAILIRFLSEEGGYRRLGSRKIWLGDLTGIEHIEISEAATEAIKRFWHSNDQVLYIGKTGGYKIVVERISQRRSLFVFGAGHVGRSLALMGAMLGLEVTLIDDRQDFLREDMIPVCGIHVLPGSFEDIGKSVLLNKSSAVVIVTRGHQHDEVILKQMAKREIGYVGMIGSRRRIEGIFRRLRREGISESFLKSVKAPVGLDIGAVSPQEIAVAVHAEIIKHFSRDLASDNS